MPMKGVKVMIEYDEDALRCNFIHCVHNTLKAHYFVVVPHKKLDEILSDHMEYEWNDPKYPYDPNDNNMDTCVRDVMLDKLSKHYTGRAWPYIAENVNMDEFIDDLVNAIGREEVIEELGNDLQEAINKEVIETIKKNAV